MKFASTFNKILFLGGIGLLGGACGGRNLGNNGDSGITGSGTATTAPTVSSITPANNATGTYIDAAIQVTFSTSINTGTVTMTSDTTCTGSLQISTDANFGAGTCLAMNQTVTQSGTQVTVRTAGLMSASTTFYVRVTTAVAGSTGLTMLTQYNSQFTTGTTTAPLPGAFGICSGANTLTDVRSAANGAINLSVPGLIVTAIDSSGHFFVQQAGAAGPAIYIRDTTNNPNLGVQVGDILCLSFGQKSEFNLWMQIDTLTAAQKTSGGGSVSAQALTVAASDTYESEIVSVSGTLTTKSSTVAGGGYNHTLTYAGGTLTIREIQGSGKMDNFVQGQAIQVTTALTQFTSYQLYIDSSMGTVVESTSGAFNVSSASTTSATTVVLTFNNTPTSAAATNIANYTGNNGLTISGASLSGITVTLTTSTQTVGQSYTITVANVLRNADNATLTTNTANFTGYAPPASFTTGQVVINEVHVAPATAAEEYVELYNTTASAISLNGAVLWYKSSAGVPGQATTLTGVIPANGYYTILSVASPTGYTCSGTLQTTGWGNSGLSNTAGAVVLTVNGTAPAATTDAGVRDIVQWASNTTNWGESGTTAPAPSSQRTLSRGPNGIDTNNTSNDFVLSPAANGTCGAHNWSTDVTAPTIASSTPASAATGVALSSTISVTFSESMYVTSVTTANLYLVQGTDCSATSITGTITAATSNTVFSFPSGALAANTQYSICIKAGVEDVALNNLAADAVRSFTTIAPDVTPPTISSTTPANNAASVAIGSTIAVTFSEAMSTGTVTAQTSAGACTGSVQVSTVTDNFATTCIGMTTSAPTFSGGNTIATFTPATALSASTSYHIRVTTGVQDVATNPLTAQFTTANGFTTAAADVTPPTISSTTPANAATGISTGTTIAVTFNEAMSTGTVTAQTSAGACSGSVQVSLDNFANCIAMTASAPTFSGGNTVATFTPGSALTASTTYKIRVTTAVQDASSNALAAQFETATGFTTGAGAATYLVQESFNYGGTGMNLTAVAASPWTAHSGAGTNSIQYNTTPLTMSGYCSGGGVGASTFTTTGEDVNRTYASQTTGTMYFAALVNLSAIGNTTGDYFLSIGAGTTNLYGRVYARNNGAGQVNFGIARINETPVYASGAYSLNTTYLIVVKSDAFGTTGQANLFVLSASSGTEPGSTNATSTGNVTSIASYSAVFLRQGTAANMPTGKVGCVTIGKSWASLFE